MKRVGIIGGMGPLASIDLYTKITQLTSANVDQDHIPLVLDSHPQIPDRTAFIMGRGPSPLPALIESAQRLEQAGCEAFAMACNTAHYFAPEVQQAVHIPLIHIVHCAVQAIQYQYPQARQIAVLATTGTRQAGIYDAILQSYGLNSVPIAPNDQDNLMHCIYQGVKKGCINEVVPLFNTTLSHISADVYIAACTEIPLLLPHVDQPYPFIDATLELAKGILQFSQANELPAS